MVNGLIQSVLADEHIYSLGRCTEWWPVVSPNGPLRASVVLVSPIFEEVQCRLRGCLR